MCGRYTIYQTGELKNRYQVSDEEQDAMLEELKKRYNAAPGQDLPVVTNHNGKNHLGAMRWGLVPVWAKDPKIGYKMINARSETVFEKPSWKRPVLKTRCLVPSNGFYEWKKTDKGKQPFLIYPEDNELFSMAGLYDSWTDRQSGEVLESFSILTTWPNKEMKSIHDRMPVILKPDDEDRWLDPSNNTPDSLADLLKPYQDGKLKVYPVSTEVNSARNDYEELIQSLPKGDHELK